MPVRRDLAKAIRAEKALHPLLATDEDKTSCSRSSRTLATVSLTTGALARISSIVFGYSTVYAPCGEGSRGAVRCDRMCGHIWRGGAAVLGLAGRKVSDEHWSEFRGGDAGGGHRDPRAAGQLHRVGLIREPLPV